MKKIALLSLFFSLLNSSCMKKTTCTCNHNDGTLNHRMTSSSLSKKDIDTYKDKCRNTSTVDAANSTSSTTYTTPCVVD